MKTTKPHISGPPRRGRSRFGYRPDWWGEAAQIAAPPPPLTYWAATKRPVPCLAFVLPILAAYEIGVAYIGGASADALRTGADAWMRQAIEALGLHDRWLSPLLLVGAILTWQAFRRDSPKFRAPYLAGMACESVILAVALVGLSRLVDVGFDRLEGGSVLEAGRTSLHPVAAVVGYLGAGVYEEAMFRLALIPAIYGAARAIHTPQLLAGTLAVTGSAMLFSLAHHAGVPGESFTWFAFIFRWLAGIFFAWVFLIRGFGIAVGTHAAYDVLVGWVGLHF